MGTGCPVGCLHFAPQHGHCRQEGRAGAIGGADIADQWFHDPRKFAIGRRTLAARGRVTGRLAQCSSRREVERLRDFKLAHRKSPGWGAIACATCWGGYMFWSFGRDRFRPWGQKIGRRSGELLRRRNGTFVHMEQLPDMPVEVLKAVLQHEAVVLWLSIGRSAGSQRLLDQRGHAFATVARQGD